MSDVIIAAANGTYTEAFTTRQTDGTTVTTTTQNNHGTYSQNGSSITLVASDGSLSGGTISGNTITANIEQFVAVYARQ